MNRFALSWQTYVVLLVPVIGLAAITRRRILFMLAAVIFLCVCVEIACGAYLTAAALWVSGHLVSLYRTLRLPHE